MKKIKLLLLMLICSSSFALGQSVVHDSLEHDELMREYLLYIPDSYTGDISYPLVLVFHGYGGHSFSQMQLSSFMSIADTAGFILAYPQGTVLDGATHWNVGAIISAQSKVDDVGFVDKLIDLLDDEYNIDSTRVYSTGMSNGGFLSLLLACQISDKIAAIASVTGEMTPKTFKNCNPQHPTPVMQIHGTADDAVPYEGGIWTKSVADVLDYWIEYNNCDITGIITDVPDINTEDSCTAEKIIYDDGDKGSQVIHYKITDGTHSWPGSFLTDAGVNQDFSASEAIWQFFSKFNIKGMLGHSAVNDFTDDIKVQVYPNPAISFTNIRFSEPVDVEYTLLNILGNKIQTGEIIGNRLKLDLSDLPRGIYILSIGNESYKVIKG